MIDYSTFATRLHQRQDRWSLLEAFIQEWELPTAERARFILEDLAEAEARLGFALPLAVREWYLLPFQPYQLETRLITHNWLVEPHNLGDLFPLTDDRLIVHSENQDCCSWAIRVSERHLDDPPVYVGSSSEPPAPDNWRLQNTTFSEFALQLVISDTFGGRGYWARADNLEAPMAALLERRFAPLGFPDWLERGSRVNFLGGPDVIVLCWRKAPGLAEGRIAVSLSARSRAGLEQALHQLPFNWDDINDSGEYQFYGPDEAELAAALQEAKEALRAAEQAGDTAGEMDACDTIAWVYEELGELDEAIRYLARSLQLRLTTTPDHLDVLVQRAKLKVLQQQRHRQQRRDQRAATD